MDAVISRLSVVHLQLIRVWIRRYEDTSYQRLVSDAIDRLAGRHRHRQVRTAMKGSGEDDDVLSLGRLLRQLHRRFDDLRAAVAKEVFAQLGPRDDGRH